MRISRTVGVGSRSNGALRTGVRWRVGVFMFACMANGCSFGMTAAKYAPALGPRGVDLQIDFGQRQVMGELIEVRDSGLVILTGAPATRPASPTFAAGSLRAPDQSRLQFVAYGDMLSWKVEDQASSWGAIIYSRAPEADVREHLRLLSRFPQGLDADLLKRLLSAHGQTELPGIAP